MEKITRQTFRASEIVNNLLNFSRTSGTEFTEVEPQQSDFGYLGVARTPVPRQQSAR